MALGFSIGDIAADTAMSRSGYPAMAISACFAGPTFNILLGLGLSITAYSFTNKFEAFPVHLTKILILSFIFLIGLFKFNLGSIFSTILIVPLSGFKVPKTYSFYLMFYYLIFVLFGILTEVGVFWK
jgi:solute carrier family 24 (sodium/potassium/calcium exchanger), member 6